VIQLPDLPLPAAAQSSLAIWQSEVDALAHYADRVDAAQRLFKQRNTQRNKTFAAVRGTLTRMCSGAQRCGYCEDSAADEVEHIWPKSLYPELVFAWRNYLYACGLCNGPKNDQFAIFPQRARKPLAVQRPLGAPVRPPRKGEPALIDPRHENPMDFLMLDLGGTFYFEPLARKGSRAHERADYTRRVLRLNAREYLPVARAGAYGAYKARLSEYITLRARRATRAQVDRCIHGIQREMHPTVWKEMQRQHTKHPELRELFRQAPEALSW
jgi:uncharacterized protein (TIGR02646 family)